MANDFGFIIARMEKHGSKSKLAHNVKHLLREIQVKGADPAKLHENIVNGPRTYAEFRKKLDAHLVGVRKFRSDSPEVIELFIGASPEFFKKGGNQEDFFNAAYQYCGEKFGKENVLLAALHRDEATPHLSVFVCPIVDNPEYLQYQAQQAGGAAPPRPRKDGKPRKREAKFAEPPPEKVVLASKYIQGQASLSNWQTEIWERVGKPYGLKRGEQGSKAKHVDTNDWKRAMARVLELRMPQFVIPPLTITDRMNPAGWAERVISGVIATATQALRDAAIAHADVALKVKKLNQTTARLQAWEASLAKQQAEFTEQVNYTAEGIARAALAGVKDELDAYRNDTTADLVPALTDQLAAAQVERTRVVRALARNIKATTSPHDMAKLAESLGVASVTGKADIFERLMKAGAAPTFEQAVLMVDAQILAMAAADQHADDQVDQDHQVEKMAT